MMKMLLFTHLFTLLTISSESGVALRVNDGNIDHTVKIFDNHLIDIQLKKSNALVVRHFEGINISVTLSLSNDQARIKSVSAAEDWVAENVTPFYLGVTRDTIVVGDAATFRDPELEAEAVKAMVFLRGALSSAQIFTVSFPFEKRGEAVAAGAKLICFPENFSFVGAKDGESLIVAECLDGPVMQKYCSLARESNIWLSLGGFQEKGPDDSHLCNTLVLVDDSGTIRSTYRKIHMFDVDVPGGMVYKESSFTEAGYD